MANVLNNKDGLIFSPLLVPENIKQGIIVLGVEGTSDGKPPAFPGPYYITPTLSDQVLNTYGTYGVSDITISKIEEGGGESLSIERAVDTDLKGEKSYSKISLKNDCFYIYPRVLLSGFLKEKTESDSQNIIKIEETEQAKIIPENIKEGVTILGVTGTASPGDSIVWGGTPQKSASTVDLFTIIRKINFNGFNIPITSMIRFEGSYVTEVDFGDATFSNIQYAGDTFSGCLNLTKLNMPFFNTEKVTDMRYFLQNCVSLTDVIWGDNWASNSAVTSCNVSDSPLSHDSCLDLFNKLATRTNSPTLTLSSTTKGYMSDEELAIATGKGWTVA